MEHLKKQNNLCEKEVMQNSVECNFIIQTRTKNMFVSADYSQQE